MDAAARIDSTKLNNNSQLLNTVKLTCYYCSSPIESRIHETPAGGMNPEIIQAETSVTRCSHRGCHKPLPSCCVCLEPLKLALVGPGNSDDWTVWCSTCRHGAHKRHVKDWFSTYKECPVAGCACLCFEIDELD